MAGKPVDLRGFPSQDGALAYNERGEVLIGAGDTAPSDGAANFAVGALWIDTNAADGSALLINEGTVTSADFNTQGGGASSAEMSVLDGATAGTTVAGKAVVTGTTNNEVVFAASATPAAVGTTPGTAAATLITATGGIGGGTSIETTGTGGIGGGFAITAGAGGVASAAATAATGGAGGAIALVTGAGGATSVATTTAVGGAGGAITETSGAGGATSSAATTSTGGASGGITLASGTGGATSGAVSGTATGGQSGNISFRSGTGGAVTATTGTNVGGASGTASFGSGTGGAASGATDTGGASGAVTISSGTGGAGDTGGASGDVNITTGAAGAGGSPAVGVIKFNPGTNEKWRIDSTGNLNSVAGTPANVTADGAITATGGISFTDVLNSWIDDATHGSGSTQHFIGNSTIDVTAPSDRRLKKGIEPTRVNALELLNRIEMVDFYWRADDAPTGKQFGVIAQQVESIIPEVVTCNAATNGFKYVEKKDFTMYLLKAVQELSAKVAALEAK